MNRKIFPYILEDLNNKKMVFIAGPRQVGKTTLAKQIMEKFQNPLYFNFDHPEDRKNLIERNWKPENEILVFDEIHKWRNWKSWLKGIYDKEKDQHKILVTGSARMDVYRKGGDSLQGRYHHYRLNPFTFGELTSQIQESFFSLLFERGGFPEPFLSKTNRNVKRWKKERMDRVVREDIFSLENLKSLFQLEILVDLLKDRVGSPLSIRSLAEDLSVSHPTVESWIRVLESMYVIFRVTPYSKKLNRAVKREYKIYFYDWTEATSEGARLENMVALHLLASCNFKEDVEGERSSLHFLKDRDGHEVDFLTTIDGKPTSLIEVKKSDTSPSRSLIYFHNKLDEKQCKSYQLIYDLKNEVLHHTIYILPMERYFSFEE